MWNPESRCRTLSWKPGKPDLSRVSGRFMASGFGSVLLECLFQNREGKEQALRGRFH